PRIDAHPAETRLPLDDGHPAAELGGLDGGALAGGATTDAHETEIVIHASTYRRSACPARSSARRRRGVRFRKNVAAGPLMMSRIAADSLKYATALSTESTNGGCPWRASTQLIISAPVRWLPSMKSCGVDSTRTYTPAARIHTGSSACSAYHSIKSAMPASRSS